MEMKQTFNNEHYKVMEVALNAGEAIPLHKTTSDAYIMVRAGAGKIIFLDKEVELKQGSTFLIPSNKEHKLEVTENFNAWVILPPDGAIKFS